MIHDEKENERLSSEFCVGFRIRGNACVERATRSQTYRRTLLFAANCQKFIQFVHFSGRLYTVGCEGTRKYIRRWVQLHVVLVYMFLLWNLEWRPEAGCVSTTILSLPLACAHAGRSIISDPLSVWWSERCRALGPSYSIKYIHSTVVISQQPHMPPYMCEWNQPTFNIIYISTKITTNRFFMCPIN